MSHSVQDFCCNDHLGVEPSGPALTAMFLNTSSQALLRNRISITLLFFSGYILVPYNKAKQAVL